MSIDVNKEKRVTISTSKLQSKGKSESKSFDTSAIVPMTSTKINSPIDKVEITKSKTVAKPKQEQKTQQKKEEKHSWVDTAVDIGADIGAGVLGGIGMGLMMAGGPITIGAVAVGVCVAALGKLAIKEISSKVRGKEYTGKQALKDTVTGGLMGLGGATSGLVKIAGKTTASFLAKEATVGAVFSATTEGGTEIARQTYHKIKDGTAFDGKKMLKKTGEGALGGAVFGGALGVARKALAPIIKPIKKLIKVKNDDSVKFDKSDKSVKKQNGLCSELNDQSTIIHPADKNINGLASSTNTNILDCIPDMSGVDADIKDKFLELISVLYTRSPQSVTLQGMQNLLKTSLDRNVFVNNRETIKYLNNFKILASKKAPNGEFILNSHDVKHLANFKTRTLGSEKVQNIKDLIWCIEEGLLPSNTLNQIQMGNPSLIFSFDKINPMILRDIEKLKFAKANGLKVIDVFMPEYDSYVKFMLKGGMKNVKAGDILCFKKGLNEANEMYYVKNDVGELSKLNLDRETLFDILPPVKRFYSQQAKSGTCYALSSYTSQLHSPQYLPRLLRRLCKRGKDIVVQLPFGSTGKNNLFAGKFPDFDKNGTIFVKLINNKYQVVDNSQSVKSNPLIKALETLYGTHRKYTYADNYIRQVYNDFGKDSARKAYDEALKNMNNYIYIKENGRLIRRTLAEQNAIQVSNNCKTFKCVEDFYKEGGTSSEIFELMTDFGIHQTTHIGCKNDNVTLGKIRRLLETLKTRNAVIEFGTPSKLKEQNESILLANKSLYSSHGYSIIGYDAKTDIVDYINPWNSAFVFQMPLKELAKYINNISGAIRS